MESLTLLESTEEFVAGEPIVLQFDGKITGGLLIVRNSWGTFGIHPDSTQQQLTFTLPKTITQKSGSVDWTLLYQKNTISTGTFSILPSTTSSNTMETYLGPTSIFADNSDQSMLVVLPQDEFGNPLPEGTEIVKTEKFGESVQSSPLMVSDMIAHNLTGAKKVVGDIFITANMAGQFSKEFTINVLPTVADDFTISMKRNHPYADGNQIVSFTTSTILDVYGNTLADGTMVNFMIQDENGKRFQTYGQTLNGVAIAKMLHPEVPGKWKVWANISGASKSNALQLEFDAAVLDYPVHISNDGKTITVGPILSYMKQWVPDGMGISLKVVSPNDGTLLQVATTSRNGMGHFALPNGIEIQKNTTIVTVAGIKKQIHYKP